MEQKKSEQHPQKDQEKNDCEQLASRTVLDSVADGIFTVNNEMQIISFNRAAERITGYSRKEVLGRYCYDIFKTEICDISCPINETLAAGESVINRELDMFDRDGNKIPVSISASVVSDDQGTPVGAVEIFRDLSMTSALKQQIEKRYRFHDLFSRSPIMHSLFDVVPDIAASDATVLIQGESGTGKELFAKAIHDASPRKDGPLVIINCGALPEPLLEAEIFGARRGAYTGAVESRPGRLEMAQGGTLFLDEIGDLPLALQVKLLRVLENREFQPLGAKNPIKADVRFVTATHRNLGAMVEEGSFRRDLFFRVNVIGFTIPPLHERKEDIPLLIDLTLERLNSSYGKSIRGFSPRAIQVLLDHDYPGNVRELLNLVEQTVILCRSGEIGVEHLPAELIGKEKQKKVTPSRGRPSAQKLLEVLERFNGNRGQMAQELGVDRTTLWRWMKRMEKS